MNILGIHLGHDASIALVKDGKLVGTTATERYSRKKKDLYIIQCDKTGAFKVGISTNVERRIKNLKTGCPYEIKLILHLEGRADLEKKLHKIC